MEGRLQSSILVNALQRRAESEGGFAAVLAKGDPTAGAVLVILAERGEKIKILERLLEGGGEVDGGAEGPVGAVALAGQDPRYVIGTREPHNFIVTPARAPSG